jgi:hypothetical protein
MGRTALFASVRGGGGEEEVVVVVVVEEGELLMAAGAVVVEEKVQMLSFSLPLFSLFSLPFSPTRNRWTTHVLGNSTSRNQKKWRE